MADSLRQAMEQARGPRKVDLMVDYAWEINESDTENAARVLRDAIALAEKTGYRKGEGAAWNGLGIVAEIKGDFEKSETFYKKALAIRQQLDDPADLAGTLNNLGLLYESTSNFEEASRIHRQSLAIIEKLGDTLRIARAHYNIASLYVEMGAYLDAKQHLNDARLFLEELKDQEGLVKVYTLMGHIQFELDRYEEARDWYAKSLDIRRTLDDPDGLALALNDYANALDELDSSHTAVSYYLQALDIYQSLNDQQGIATIYVNLGDAYKHLGDFEPALDYLAKAEVIRAGMDDPQGIMEVYNTQGDVYRRQRRFQKALTVTGKYFAIAQSINDAKYIQRAYKDYAALYEAMGDYRKAFEYRVQYDEYRYGRLNERISMDMARKDALFTDQKLQLENEKKAQEIEKRKLVIERQRTQNAALVGGGIALLLLAGLLYNRNRIRARANQELAAKNADIEKARARADALLTNILPEETARELKEHNKVRPVRYESVSVLFSDFKNFTRIAEQMSPEELVAELDEYFRMFDEIVEGYGLEKIKTIGDAYMCAGGLPTPNQTHAVDVATAAIAMQRGLQQKMQEKKAAGKPFFEMRIGIHTGPVVAGVVGSHKFAYDIWGDTVNTAARMEQGSEPGKINISETTYQLVKNHFRCQYRGELKAKNKGEIAMYFLEYD